jgi:hypothetical protein
MATRSSHLFSSTRFSTENHSTPAFWFGRLASDGIMVTHIGTAPSLVGVGYNLGSFQDRIHAVVEAGFPRVIDFDFRHPRTTKAWNYAIAFKSKKTEARWHLTEAHVQLEIHRRVRHHHNGGDPFGNFDSLISQAIEFPSKASAEHFCRHFGEDDFDCQRGHGLDPTVTDIPVELLKVQKSQVGENAGRGVFSTVNIAPGSYLGVESSSHLVAAHWKTWTLMLHLYERIEALYEGNGAVILLYYFDGYGCADEPWVSE